MGTRAMYGAIAVIVVTIRYLKPMLATILLSPARHMTKNMGFIDRTVRLLVVALIAVLYFAGRIDGTPAIALGIVAVVFFLTSLIGSCPLYSLVGMSTRKAASTSPAKP